MPARLSLSCALVLVLAVGLAASQTWKTTISEFATIASAVSFVDEKTGVAPVGLNGSPAVVYVTTDGGNTFNPVPTAEIMMFMGGAAQGTSSVATGFGLLFSDTLIPGSYNFSDAIFLDEMISQSAEAFKGSSGSSYGVTGSTLLGGNGVAVTMDGGLSFSMVNVSNFRTEARYGSFPSATTWYLSGGEWPGNNSKSVIDQLTNFELTKRWSIKRRFDGNGNNVMKLQRNAAGSQPTDDCCWKAQIMKTGDGGKTWSSVFYDEGNFYFNQIDCSSETHCIAVGEADTSSQPGIRVYVTNDGGKSWNRTYFNPNPDMSLMAARCISDTEAWVAGGLLSSTSFEAYFFHTTDGGNTWTSSTVPGVYANSLSFPSSSVGFATAFNELDTSSFMAYS